MTTFRVLVSLQLFLVHEHLLGTGGGMAGKGDGGRVGRWKVTQRKSFSVQYRCTVYAALYSTYEPEAEANVLPY